MAHHKRGRPKSQRAGCLFCKPHKDQSHKDREEMQTRQEKRASISEKEQKTVITNEREYEITAAWAERFRESYEALLTYPPSDLRQLQIDAHKSQLDDLLEQLQEYRERAGWTP